MLPIVKKHLFMRKNIALSRVCLVKYFLPALIEIQWIKERPMHFLTLDWNTKLIPSESTFSRKLCRMVAYKVLKSKVEIDSFFLDSDFI